MSICARKNSGLALEKTTTRTSVSFAWSVSMRLARSDCTNWSKRLMGEWVLLITTLSTPDDWVVWSVPYDGYRAAYVQAVRRARVVTSP